MTPSPPGPLRFPIGAITDEFTPAIASALPAMAGLGMTAVELRVIDGTNIIDLDDDQVARIVDLVRTHGMSVISIASPLLKCVLPDGPPLDDRFQQDVFAARHTFEDQPRLTRRAFEIAHITGARIIRVFSYWRTTNPDACFDRIVDALSLLAVKAWDEGLVIGLENEHACNVGTATELARVLEAVDHPGLRAVWDPANALVAGETPFPDGYRKLATSRIAHVHAKDCVVSGHTPTWGLLGTMDVDWRGQIDALAKDGYDGAITLETHWKGPNDDKFEASTLCGKALRELVENSD